MVMNEKRTFLDEPIVRQFLGFCLVGLSNTGVALATFYYCVFLGMHYLVANVLAWVISVFNAFYWNNKYVFQSRVSWRQGLVRSYMSYGASFLLGTVILYVLIDIFSFSVVLAPLFVFAITTPINFSLNKYWAFRRKV